MAALLLEEQRKSAYAPSMEAGGSRPSKSQKRMPPGSGRSSGSQLLNSTQEQVRSLQISSIRKRAARSAGSSIYTVKCMEVLPSLDKRRHCQINRACCFKQISLLL